MWEVTFKGRAKRKSMLLEIAGNCRPRKKTNDEEPKIKQKKKKKPKGKKLI